MAEDASVQRCVSLVLICLVKSISRHFVTRRTTGYYARRLLTRSYPFTRSLSYAGLIDTPSSIAT